MVCLPVSAELLKPRVHISSHSIVVFVSFVTEGKYSIVKAWQVNRAFLQPLIEFLTIICGVSLTVSSHTEDRQMVGDSFEFLQLLLQDRCRCIIVSSRSSLLL